MAHRHPLWHYIGVFLLLVAWVFLLVSSISAPVFGDIAIAKVILTNKTDIRQSSVTFGAFGYCVLDVPPVNTDQDWCSSRTIGYSPTHEMSQVDNAFQVSNPGALDSLTNGFVLHPIATLVAFLAFLVALVPFWLASLLGAMTAMLAFILCLVVMALDIAVFRPIKDRVNSDGSNLVMSWSTGLWLVVVATICLFLASIITFLSCCSTRESYKARSRRGI